MTDTFYWAAAFTPDFQPRLRDDLILRGIGQEVIAWTPDAPLPIYLDPVGALLAQVFDGAATLDELVDDVRDALDVEQSVALGQLQRVLSLLGEGGALVLPPSESHAWTPQRALLPQPNW
jgi:hypothetical protein